MITTEPPVTCLYERGTLARSPETCQTVVPVLHVFDRSQDAASLDNSQDSLSLNGWFAKGPSTCIMHKKENWVNKTTTNLKWILRDGTFCGRQRNQTLCTVLCCPKRPNEKFLLCPNQRRVWLCSTILRLSHADGDFCNVLQIFSNKGAMVFGTALSMQRPRDSLLSMKFNQSRLNGILRQCNILKELNFIRIHFGRSTWGMTQNRLEECLHCNLRKLFVQNILIRLTPVLFC